MLRSLHPLGEVVIQVYRVHPILPVTSQSLQTNQYWLISDKLASYISLQIAQSEGWYHGELEY
jgi:hypothetical protein